MTKYEKRKIGSAILACFLSVAMVLPCFSSLSFAAETTVNKAKYIKTWDFSENTQISDYDLYAAGTSSFSITGGTMKASGTDGEMKALVKESFKGGSLKSISVDIIPNGTEGLVNVGIYIGASEAGNAQDQINALGFLVESFKTEDPNLIDIVTGSFPTWTELARTASEQEKGNNLYTNSEKKPLNFRLDFDEDNITATISLIEDSSKYTQTVYLCDTSKITGQVGLRAFNSDVSFDNFKIEYMQETEELDDCLILPGINKPYVEMEKAVATIPQTVEMWVWVDGTSEASHHALVGAYDADTQSGSVGAWNFDIYEGKLRWVDMSSKGASGQLKGTKAIPKNEWVHVAVTRGNGQVNFYVNGEQAGTVNHSKYEENVVSNVVPTLGYSMFHNWASNNLSNYLDGAMKDVRIWNVTRTADEIKNNMNATFNGNEEGLMNYWKLDKMEGNVYKDATQSSNDVFFSKTYTNEGINNTEWTDWQVSKKIDRTVRSLEAWIKVPTSIKDNSRLTIISGYPNTSCHMDIYTHGRPRLWYPAADGSIQNYIVDEDLRTNEWTHLAWVIDDVAGTATCYINGKSVYVSEKAGQTISVPKFYVARDNRGGWEYPFMGQLADIRVWEKTLTADEVKYSMNTENIGIQDGLLLNIPLDEGDNAEEFRDLSGNDNTVLNMPNGLAWIDVEKKPSDYSIAIIPDQQYLTAHWVDKLNGIYEWIAANVEKENMQMVINLGDITDNNSTQHWERAKNAYNLLQNKVPYICVAGNHDYNTANYRDAINMNTYFPLSMFRESKTYGGSYSEDNNLPDDVLNTWQEFKVCGNKYLVLALEFSPRDSVLEWANEVVAAHPYHQVIVVTHGYMDYDGTLLEGDDKFAASDYEFIKSQTEPANDAKQMWDKFVKKHENIIFVLSGHIFANDDIVMRTDIGDHGNEVRQFLIDAQALDTRASGLGMVAMMNFSNDGQTVEVTYYCPSKGKYMNHENQFTITVPALEHEPADKAALNIAISEAEALQKEDYTSPSWYAFAEVLKEVKKVAADSDVDQSDVLMAVASLQDAKEALVLMGENDREATYTFTDVSEAEDFALYQSSNGSFAIEDGKLVSKGEIEQFKAIIEEDGRHYKSLSVDIYPDIDAQIFAGIYIGASNVGHQKDKLEGVVVSVESYFTGWDDAPNRVDICVGSFPEWIQLHRVVSETGLNNALYQNGEKRPLTLQVDIEGKILTITLSLKDDPTKFIQTVYEYTGEYDLEMGQVGLHMTSEGSSFDNLYLLYENTVDKTMLKNVVAEVEMLSKEEYVSSTWTALQEALENAKEVLNDTDPTQTEADTALTELKAAKEALVNVADKTALNEAVKEVEALKKADYTGATWTVLQKALNDAKEVLSNPDAVQTEADAALTELKAAKKALVNVADKTALNEAVKEVEALKKADYTEATWTVLQAALNDAKEVLSNPDAVQVEADAALNTLKAAKDSLKMYEESKDETTKPEINPDKKPDTDQDKNNDASAPQTGDDMSTVVLTYALIAIVFLGISLFVIENKRKIQE